jgi:hypothetical protein
MYCYHEQFNMDGTPRQDDPLGYLPLLILLAIVIGVLLATGAPLR